jgi:hypothetical protein
MNKTKVQKEPNFELLLQQLKHRLLAQGIRPQIIDTAKIIKVTDMYIYFGMWKFMGVLRVDLKSIKMTFSD